MREIVVNKLRYLPRDRYIQFLERMCDRIDAGLELAMVDSDEIGNKYTHASWGMCTDDREAWPDAQDHIWPEEFEKRGRVAPISRGEHQPCPFDDRSVKRAGGCFWRCRLFRPKQRPKRGQPPVQRDEALKLYQIRIDRAKAAGHGG